MLLNPFILNAPALSLSPENIRKPQGVEKGCIGNEWVKEHLDSGNNLKIEKYFNFFPNIK